ncbi:Fucose permease [Quadrisphaera granulorum]|uniref:Fucose permease n=1 Tax=Quadrisphaera granulorum TaxID=317664 RepID=A0A316AC30_9ACTN|nr:MFS transporter [Quadrisphaera granulorum]PWJ54434.1 fucose permease [Quadrisphaera granulorum]SZE96206.1 Fucose permease [Quadrisphaera granulorum]
MRRDPAASSRSTTRSSWAPYAAFTAFGLFWGAWGAALPALRDQAGVSEGRLGVALLFVGLGALPAMVVAGRAVDRLGLRVAAWLLAALGGAGVLIAATAHGMPSLIIGMLLVGASSGAADVAINALAGRAEHISAKPLLIRSHGLFSCGVVASSLATGVALGVGATLPAAFTAVTVVVLALAAVTHRACTLLVAAATPDEPTNTPARAVDSREHGRRGLLRLLSTPPPLLVVGLVAALALAIENAHQSWGAVMLTDVFNASPPLAAVAPATFAATAAVARLSLAPLSRTHPMAMLLAGGALAAAGSAVLATASSVPVAVSGLLVAALGTSTLFPTLLSRSLRDLDPALHGRATSAVAATGYLGFLLGPAYVGLLAEATNLRGAMLGIAALALCFTVAAAPVSSWAARRHRTNAGCPRTAPR